MSPFLHCLSLVASLGKHAFRIQNVYLHVIGSAKSWHICTKTKIHFLLVHESYTHALSRNTKYLTIDGKVCFHGWLFEDALEPRGCISQP